MTHDTKDKPLVTSIIYFYSPKYGPWTHLYGALYGNERDAQLAIWKRRTDAQGIL